MVMNISNIKPHEISIISLYCDDYKKGIHIREIARQLGKNHRTVILALQELEKKAVMRAKTEGRNKIYTLNLDNFVTREYIRSAEIAKTITLLEKHFLLKKFAQEILSDAGSVPLVLFGSYAKGTETKESDIDLLVFTDHYQYKADFEKRIQDFSKRYKKRIQVQKGNRDDFEKGLWARDPLILEIVQNHVVLNNYSHFIGMLWMFAHER